MRKRCTEVEDFTKGRRDLFSPDAFSPYKGQVKAVVFDMDGTIIDSIGQIIDCTKRALLTCRIPIPDDLVIMGMIGKRLNEGIESILPDSFKPYSKEVTAVYRQIFSQNDEIRKPVLFPGIFAMLKTLHEKGYKIGFASGKSQRGVARTLEETDLTRLSSGYCSGDEAPSKPHPLMMQVVSWRLGVSPHEILGVGDTGMDIEMYHNASCISCAVQSGVWSGEALTELDPHLLLPDASYLKDLL